MVAAPVLAATVVMRVPLARERLAPRDRVCWCSAGSAGSLSVALVDPITVNDLQGARSNAAAASVSTRSPPAAPSVGATACWPTSTTRRPLCSVAAARGGIFGPQSEPFALAMLFARIDTPFVAVPDPQSNTGASDRLDKAFPSLFRDGLPGYRVIYQNNTWRLFGRAKDISASKD